MGDSGVCGIPSPVEGRVVEFVASNGRSGRHGTVGVTLLPGHAGSLLAELSVGGQERARCASHESIRFWGRFGGDTHVRLAADGAVRLVARSAAGEVLAGPVEIGPARPWATLAW